MQEEGQPQALPDKQKGQLHLDLPPTTPMSPSLSPGLVLSRTGLSVEAVDARRAQIMAHFIASPKLGASATRQPFLSSTSSSSASLAYKLQSPKMQPFTPSGGRKTSIDMLNWFTGSQAGKSHVLNAYPSAGADSATSDNSNFSGSGAVPESPFSTLSANPLKTDLTDAVRQAENDRAAKSGAMNVPQFKLPSLAKTVDNNNINRHESVDSIKSAESDPTLASQSPLTQSRGLGSPPFTSIQARSAGVRWTAEQDKALTAAVGKYGAKHWKLVADLVPNRNHVQCRQRWKKVLRPGLVKGPWTPEEDEILIKLVEENKDSLVWSAIAEKVPGRTAKQCREHWCLFLDPNINRTKWSPEEDTLLVSLYEKIGSRWAEIKCQFVGRTENAVKTRFKSLMRAKAREWSKEEDLKLLELYHSYGNDWAQIASKMPNRTRSVVQARYKHLSEAKEQPSASLSKPMAPPEIPAMLSAHNDTTPPQTTKLLQQLADLTSSLRTSSKYSDVKLS